MPEHIALGCNIAAGLLVLLAFVVYNLRSEKISTGTWIILAFGDSLDLASYFEMTDDWWRSIVPATFAFGSLVTFVVGFLRKRFAWPDPFDCFIVVLDFVIIGGWAWLETNGLMPALDSHKFAPAAVANIALQATALIALVPMWRAHVRGREREQPVPWILWSLAFMVFSISTALNFATYEELVYPVVGLLTHAPIALLALLVARPLRT